MVVVDRHVDVESMVVTASTPIVVTAHHQEAVAAVVGLRMQYRRFYELFTQSTIICDYNRSTPCNFTCRSDVSRHYYHYFLTLGIKGPERFGDKN